MSTWKKWASSALVRRNYFVREEILFNIRQFFRAEKFHEVETPVVRPYLIPESYYEYFETLLLDRNRKRKKAWLSPSPESSLKKLLSAGFGNCFEITKCFRNTETQSNMHNPEFTLLEWYEVDADYSDSMELLQKLILNLFSNLKNKGLIKGNQNFLHYKNFKIDINAWEKISMPEAFQKYAKLDLNLTINPEGKTRDDIFNSKIIGPIALKKGYSVNKKNTWEEIFNQIYLNEVEPNLGIKHPVIIYDFPAPMAALAKMKKGSNIYAERFELYIANLELADCYTELTDWKEQEKRMNEEL